MNVRPHVTDFWISIVSGVFFFWAKKITTTLLYPLVRTIVCKPAGESDKLVDYKAGKAAAKAWNVILHASFALGAYILIRGKPYQPWWLGGKGDLHIVFENSPFCELD